MAQMTKRALEASLKRLLLEKPLSRITISEIAEDCGINRMTFYYHFKDIYDLVEWCFAEDVKRATEGNMSFGSWQEGFLNVFRLAAENKPLVMNVYQDMDKEHILRYVAPFVHNVVRGTVDRRAAGTDVSEEDKKFIADFYEYAFIGLMLSWIEGDMREDPAVIVERTSRLISGNIDRALESFQPEPVLSNEDL